MNKKLIVLMLCLFGVGLRASEKLYPSRSNKSGYWVVKDEDHVVQKKYKLDGFEAVCLVDLLNSEDMEKYLGIDGSVTNQAKLIIESQEYAEKLQKLVDERNLKIIKTPHGVDLGPCPWLLFGKLKFETKEKQQKLKDDDILRRVISKKIRDGNTAIIKKVIEGDGLVFFNQCFEHGPLIEISRDIQENNSCNENKLELMEYLATKCNVNEKYKKKDGVSVFPLHYAALCRRSHDLACRLLYKCHARVPKSMIGNTLYNKSDQGYKFIELYRSNWRLDDEYWQYDNGHWLHLDAREPKKVLFDHVLPYVQKEKKTKKDGVIKSMCDCCSEKNEKK